MNMSEESLAFAQDGGGGGGVADAVSSGLQVVQMVSPPPISMLARVFQLLINCRELIIACAVIGLLLLVAGIVYVLVFIAYPRPFALCHTESVEDELATLLTEHVVPSIGKFASLGGSTGRDAHLQLPAELSDVAACARSLVAQKVDVDDWTFFYMFREYLLHGTKTAHWIFTRFDGNMIVKMAPERIVALLCPGGAGPDQAAVDAYRQGPFAAMDRFRAALAAAVARLGALRREPDPGRLEHLLECMYLDLVLNGYEKQIVHAFNMRRTHGFVLQLNLLKVYFSELTTYVFAEQIRKNTWGAFGEHVKSMTEGVKGAWNAIMEAVDAKRKELIESFVDGPAGTAKPEVREHFEAILGIIPVFMFLFELLKMVFMFIKKLSDFVKDPLGFILWVIQVLVLTMLQIFMKIFGAFFVALLAGPVAFVVVFVMSVVVTAMWVAIYAAMMVQLLLWTVVDMATGGAVVRLLRCENRLDAWATAPAFKDGSVFGRFFACYSPCASGYRPFGALCAAKPATDAALCPHQYIYRAAFADAKDGTTTAPQTVEFAPSARFWSRSGRQKHDDLGAFYDGLAQYVVGCSEAFQPYDHVVRSLCANLDALVPPDGGARAENEKLRELCRQVYCDFAKAPAEFCAEKPAEKPAATELTKDKIVVWILASAAVTATLAALFLNLGGGIAPSK